MDMLLLAAALAFRFLQAVLPGIATINTRLLILVDWPVAHHIPLPLGKMDMAGQHDPQRPLLINFKSKAAKMSATKGATFS
jgi:hypothetical protein